MKLQSNCRSGTPLVPGFPSGMRCAEDRNECALNFGLQRSVNLLSVVHGHPTTVTFQSRKESRTLRDPAASRRAQSGAARVMNAELRPNSKPQIDGIRSSMGANERVERDGHGRCFPSAASRPWSPACDDGGTLFLDA